MKRHEKALVTLTIGDAARRGWERNCQRNWQAYADRHGYDIVRIGTPLDDSERARSRSPAWQKCLVLGHDAVRAYEQVVWIDSDILINTAQAPCAADGVPLSRVGGVDVYGSPTAELYRQSLERDYATYERAGMPYVRNLTAREYYEAYGLPDACDRVVQSGVLVLSPRHHRECFETVYYAYEEKGGPEWNYEMRPLSYELVRRGLMHWIDHRFNLTWSQQRSAHYPFLASAGTGYATVLTRAHRRLRRAFGMRAAPSRFEKACINAAFENSYFFHFAGFGYSLMPAVELPEARAGR